MKPLDKEILLTKHFPPEYLNTYFSKPLKIFSKDFIIRDFKPIKEIQSELNNENDFIVTSKNATRYILQLPLSGNFYCVGETSAKLLQENDKKVITVQEDAASLAQWFINQFSAHKTVVYFCSNIRGNTLSDALLENNISLKEIITYKTSPASIEELKEYDAYAFFSPSGVKSFHQKNKIHKKAAIFAIGDTTGKALKELGYQDILIPDSPNTDQLFKKIQSYYGY